MIQNVIVIPIIKRSNLDLMINKSNRAIDSTVVLLLVVAVVNDDDDDDNNDAWS